MEYLPKVFVIMPFSEDFHALYNHIKDYFKEKFEFINAGDMDNQQNILADIVKGIDAANVIIADLTGLNPNVFYELGLAHAMNKKVIIITQNIDELPFDIKSYRANSYSLLFHKLPDLLEKLQKLLDGAIDGTTHYGNPVTDYAPTRTLAVIPKKEAEYNVSVEEKEIQMENAEEDEPKGFLDFQAEIDEQAKLLTQEIVEVGADMVEMTKSINNANSEIQRVKQNGSLNASFAQRVLKGLSEPVQKFSQDLKGHVERMGQSWQIIENGYLGLLENEFMLKENNLQSLPRTRKSLTQLKTSMIESNLRYKNLIVSSETCLGLERRLNKAIHSLTSELDGYLSMTGVMVASIDRIVARIDVVISNKGCFYGQ